MAVFHADPHPGTVFLTDDNRLALLDLGMGARVGPTMQEQSHKLPLAISDVQNHRDAESSEKRGATKENSEPVEFRHRISDLVNQQQNATIEHMQVGRGVMDVTRIADDFFFQAEDGIRVGTVTGVQTCALPI